MTPHRDRTHDKHDHRAHSHRWRTPVALVALLASCPWTIGCANTLTRLPPPPSTAWVADSMLIARINYALRVAGVEGYARIQIESIDGDVVLQGAMPSRDAVEQAVSIARGVKGVRCVTPRLTVEGESAEGEPG